MGRFYVKKVADNTKKYAKNSSALEARIISKLHEVLSPVWHIFILIRTHIYFGSCMLSKLSKVKKGMLGR